MARKCFYSFHYKPDNWRASKVRNIGAIDGNQPVSDNDWETVTKGGDQAIQRWIAGQLSGRSCTIVLIGTGTAGRKWINYEITESWNSNKGLLGIYIHNITDVDNDQSAKGNNPFAGFSINKGTTPLSDIVHAYDPPCSTSKDTYNYIANNMEDWVEKAVKARQSI